MKNIGQFIYFRTPIAIIRRKEKQIPYLIKRLSYQTTNTESANLVLILIGSKLFLFENQNRQKHQIHISFYQKANSTLRSLKRNQDNFREKKIMIHSFIVSG